MVENTIDHIFQLDKNLTIKYINHVSPGLTKEQVIGSNLLDLLPERKYKVLAQKTINRVFDTGIAESYEIVYPSPFGPLNYTTSVSPVIKNGEIIRVNLISRDDTEQVKLKNSLIEKQNFIDKLNSYSQNGIYIYDVKKGLNTFINKAYTDILGYSLNDINNFTPDEFFACFHPKDQQAIGNYMGKVTQLKEGDFLEIEYRFKAKSGNWVWCKSYDSGFEYDENGELISFIGSFIDITNLKETEQKLKKQKNEFENFAHFVSHDLKSPLHNIIIGLKSFKNPNLTDDDKALIQEIISSSKRANQMIDSLLIRATLNEKNEKEYFDAKLIVTELTNDLDNLIKKNQVTIKTKNLPEIYSVKPMFRSLLQNLISNAIKYKSPSIAPKIEISCQENLSYWLFNVKDNGLGIPKKDFQKIFKMFGKGSNITLNEGVGIGLSNCKKIVLLHKGKIWVESKLDKGSTFSFTISKDLD